MPDALPDIGMPYAAISPTSVPDFSNLLQTILAKIPTDFPSFQDVISKGMSSPILQQILGPALKNLIPGEELARQNLTDEFRTGGALGGGAHGVASSRLENALQGQRGNLISQILSSFLPTLVSGYGQQINAAMSPVSLLNQVLSTLRPSIVTDPYASLGRAGRGTGGVGGAGGAYGPQSSLGGTPTEADAMFGQVPYGPASPFGSGPGGSSPSPSPSSRPSSRPSSNRDPYSTYGVRPGTSRTGLYPGDYDLLSQINLNPGGLVNLSGAPTGRVSGFYNQGTETDPFFIQDPFLQGPSTVADPLSQYYDPYAGLNLADYGT